MTEGSDRERKLYGDVLRLAWPSLVELMLTQLTSMADLIMVGGLGSYAVAAIGLSSQPKFLLMSAIMALNVGATAMVARFKGMGEQRSASEVLRQALLLNVAVGAVMSVAGFILAEPLVRFMGANHETLADAAAYLRIQMAGLLTVAVTSTITASLRGAGYTRQAMVYNVVANGVNLIGNYLLIEGHFGLPRLEVAGASLATVVGQFAAMLMAIAVVWGEKHYVSLLIRERFRPGRDLIRRIVRIGLPSMLEQVIMRIGMIFYAKVVAGLGTVVFATHQACLNIQALSFMNGQAFGIAASALVGQNLGAQNPELADAYAKRARRLGMAVSVSLMFVLFFLGGPIVSLYLDEPDAVRMGAGALKIMAFILPFQSSQLIIASALRGAGDTRAVTVYSIIGVLLIRPAVALLLVNVFMLGLNGAWYAIAVDQLARSALTLARLNGGKWKMIRV